ncbi:MAG: hypothetical protein CM15mP120_12550 [Pseudomonadota bacterium]|nr:MAG: hypothetical protein CM15mP120_12550 [Pseudomonadota bacterium]
MKICWMICWHPLNLCQSGAQTVGAGNGEGMVHITGGGFYENIPRVLVDPQHAALIDLDSWQRPEVFSWLQQAGNISDAEMLTTFNCGLGLLLIVTEEDCDAAVQALTMKVKRRLWLARSSLKIQWPARTSGVCVNATHSRFRSLATSPQFAPDIYRRDLYS